MTGHATPDLLGPEEVRSLLGISTATYYRWLRENKLRGIKVGRGWRFPRESIDALLGTGDPAEMRRRSALDEARDISARRLRAAGLPPEEIASMLEATNSNAEAVVDLVLRHAVLRRASDLHLTPMAEGLVLRERIDGMLRPLEPALPGAGGADVMSALKRLAGLDPQRVGLPQRGRYMASLDGRHFDVRCAIFPTAQGESATLRIIDPDARIRSVQESGLPAQVREGLQELLRSPTGLIVLTGATGAGKTSTAYALLQELNLPGRKVMSVEDPVEVLLDGVLQAEVAPGFGFPDAMRAMLGADLDVAYVSEIRDSASLDLTYKMAHTGHLVITCLHAPDAISALLQVLELGGVPRSMIVGCTLGILAQRLAPASCPTCRRLTPLSEAETRALELPPSEAPEQVARNAGCEACHGTGTRGRLLLGELLTIGPDLDQAIASGDRATVAQVAAGGLRTLRDDALERLAAGEIQPGHAATVLGLVAVEAPAQSVGPTTEK